MPRQTVLRALAQVLSSRPFRTSKQCQMFLQYVVVNSVDGREEALKERIIGAQVLERSANYNTADDPVVRIRAADVRKRLAMYYQNEGRDAHLRITIPSGSYRAYFQPWDHAADTPAPSHELTPAEHLSEDAETGVAALSALANLHAEPKEPHAQAGAAGLEPPRRPSRKRAGFFWAAISAALVVLSIGFFFWQANRESHRQFDLFWAPTIEGARSPIIYVGLNTVYRLKDSFLARYQATHPDFKPNPSGIESAPSIDPKEALTFGDLFADDHEFVGFGDVAAAVAISSLFKERNVRFDLRFGRDIVFGDFRTTPVVLIGAFNNIWTLELNDKLPYRFTERNGQQGIEGEGQFWQTKRADDATPREDYSLITRQISPKSGQPVISVAGLDMTGTRAAAEFVANPSLLDSALRKLPSGWQNRKVQLVLHTSVIDYVPSGNEVIASSVQ